MQAIILAAGMGKRLKELTENNTKCMVKVGDKTLIERLLNQIDSISLQRIVIVSGYKSEELKNFIATLKVKTPIVFINNPIYNTTNNIYSLSLAEDYLKADDTLLFESDIIFEDSILESLVNDPRKTLALVAKYEPWMDGTCVELGDNDEILHFISKDAFDFNDKEKYYKTVNIYKFSKEFSESYYIPFLKAYVSALGKNEYYEQVLSVIAMLKEPVIRAKRIEKGKWYEIDDAQDLDIATALFAEGSEKAKLLQHRYGGYWRFSDILDFCYLVNPYYPPKQMVEELKSSFDILLTQYPSGQSVNSLIAAKDFNISKKFIAVGNGAAELIKELMNELKGKTGFIRPTFEEYPNRYAKEEEVIFTPDNPDYSYTAENIMDFFSSKEIKNLIIINPDNPSGSYMPKAELLYLISWTKERNINLIIDESFADFADEDNNTLLDNDLLDSNHHLYVMKSISKSYGVPGLRLGILASGNVDMMDNIRKSLSIWNINSFGEYYLQIASKYEKSYSAALDKLRDERRYLTDNLSKISGIRVIPSQANYLMIELTNGIKAKDLTEKLLSKHNILIKDLSEKLHGKEYIRIAVRNREDNESLLHALHLIL